MYALVGSNIIKNLFLFSAINRNMLGNIDLPKSSTEAEITWVNHTNYIYILQTGILEDSQYISGSYFLNVGPNTQLEPNFIDYENEVDTQRYLNPTLLAFNMNITSDEVYDGIFDRLDYFYLFLTSAENSIRLDIAPFNWDRCASSHQNNTDFMMYYGRYRNCGKEGCLAGYQNRTNFHFSKDEIAIQCQRMTCQNDLVMHVANNNFNGTTDRQFPKFDPADTENHYTSEDKKINYTKLGKSLRMKTKSYNFYCLERYELSVNETGVANDNGCSRGFNLDHSGICRACDYMSYSEHRINFYPSDCFLWISWRGIWDDTLTYDWYHYNKTLLNKNLYYKGYKGNEFLYRKIFREEKDDKGKVVNEIQDHLIFLGMYQLRESKTYFMLKGCYSLSWNPAKTPKYDLKPEKGFSLNFITKDPTGQAISQVEKRGDVTPLNTFYCRKTCLQGYYYDFNSISCRRCNYGCAVCEKFSQCKLCEPGFKLVKKPNHTIHKVDDEMIGQCQLDCQHGF